jgi:hypothetical protein
MRQTLSYACEVLAIVTVGYGFWVVWSACRGFADVPSSQRSYAIISNMYKYKGRVAIYFVLIAVLVTLAMTLVATTPK